MTHPVGVGKDLGRCWLWEVCLQKWVWSWQSGISVYVIDLHHLSRSLTVAFERWEPPQADGKSQRWDECDLVWVWIGTGWRRKRDVWKTFTTPLEDLLNNESIPFKPQSMFLVDTCWALCQKWQALVVLVASKRPTTNGYPDTKNAFY